MHRSHERFHSRYDWKYNAVIDPRAADMPKCLQMNYFRFVGDDKTLTVSFNTESVHVSSKFMPDHVIELSQFRMEARQPTLGARIMVEFRLPFMKYSYLFARGTGTMSNSWLEFMRSKLEKLVSALELDGKILSRGDTYYDDMVPQWYEEWRRTRNMSSKARQRERKREAKERVGKELGEREKVDRN
jgi:hypothetical protein